MLFRTLCATDRRLIVDGLALFFGIGAWLGVNGTFGQIPLFVRNAPESWNLPAFMSLAAASANIGPILFGIYSKFVSRKYDHILIYLLLAGGTTAMACLAAFHEETAHIFGADRSTAVLGVMFAAAIIGCTSSVLFMPYMRNYREIYLVTYLVGEALSGFIPGVLALVQGIGGNPECVLSEDSVPGNETYVSYNPPPRFDSTVFLAVLSSIYFLSFLGFFGLNVLPVSRRERVEPPGVVEPLESAAVQPAEEKSEKETGKEREPISDWNMSRTTYIYLLVMMGIVCSLGNTGLTSIQSYACLPYGNVAFHLSVQLGSMALPLAMCIGFVVKNHRVDVLTVLTAGVVALGGFLYYLALMSPSPPLQNTTGGEFMVVISWIAVNALVGFVKLGVTSIFRRDPGRGLFYTGVATQIGSLTGAVVSFCLVNLTDLFQMYAPCDNYVP